MSGRRLAEDTWNIGGSLLEEVAVKILVLDPRAGISATALGRWEPRKAEPSLAGFCAWAEELGFELALVRASRSRARAGR